MSLCQHLSLSLARRKAGRDQWIPDLRDPIGLSGVCSATTVQRHQIPSSPVFQRLTSAAMATMRMTMARRRMSRWCPQKRGTIGSSDRATGLCPDEHILHPHTVAVRACVVPFHERPIWAWLPKYVPLRATTFGFRRRISLHRPKVFLALL